MADKIINDSNIASFLSKLATKLSSLFWKKADVVQIGIDSTPTENSTNLVTSGGVYNAVQSSSSATWGNITGTLSNQADLDAALSGKTDVVTGATSGNFAALDSNGNLIDSGHKHSDYLTSFIETDPVFGASAAAGIQAADITAWNGKYTKPSGGIPETDLASAVTAKLNKQEIFWAEYDVTTFADIYAAYQAGKYVVVKDGSLFYTPYLIDNGSALFVDIEDDGYCYFYRVSSNGWEFVLEYHIPNDGMWEVWSGKYDKPSTGIPATDLATAVQTSLGKADTAYQKPSTGVPETDLAQAVREKLNSASVFVATYDETTNDEIWEAYSAGKTVIALLDGRSNIFVCVHAQSNYACFFTITDEFYATTISVDNDSWMFNGNAWCVYDEQIAAWNAKYTKPSGGIPKSDLASAVQTSLGKADTALQSFTETDPTVPAWAKASTKPSYTASEVGALPDTTVIPDQLSDLSDDTTHRLVTDTEKANWNAKYSKPSGGIPASDLASGVIPDVSNFITKSVNDLANYYLKSETYTKDEVAALIGAIQQFHYEIYASLPASGESNVLYLIGPTGSGTDKYEEYVYASGSFVKIGDTSIDLSQYVTTTALNTALADYTITADLGTLAFKDTVSLNKGGGDNVLGSDATFSTTVTPTTSKLVTTTIPNVTNVGSASTWSFALGTGDDEHTLFITGGNGTAPTLGTAKTVATGTIDASGGGAVVATGISNASTSVSNKDEVKVAVYGDLNVSVS